jgi:hypothetical protein
MSPGKAVWGSVRDPQYDAQQTKNLLIRYDINPLRFF